MTDLQLEANRANAQKSTGPKTEEGKQRSRLNATRHGLTGQVSIMTDEERAAHIAFTGPILKRLAPKGPVETQYAQLIAQDHWRLNRLASIEESILALGEGHPATRHEGAGNPQTDTALTQANVFLRESKQMQLLTLYGTRIQRNIERNQKQLDALQAKRAAELAQALEEAELLAELAAHEKRTFDPAEFGFVFSLEEIEGRIRKRNLLERARELRKLQTVPIRRAA